jgi:hypothetical protein
MWLFQRKREVIWISAAEYSIVLCIFLWDAFHPCSHNGSSWLDVARSAFREGRQPQLNSPKKAIRYSVVLLEKERI